MRGDNEDTHGLRDGGVRLRRIADIITSMANPTLISLNSSFLPKKGSVLRQCISDKRTKWQSDEYAAARPGDNLHYGR